MKEEWKDAVGYEGLYQVSNLGRVKNRSKILKGGLTTSKYQQVCLTKNHKQKSQKVHRLIGKAFIDNPEHKPCINHKDGNKLNNNESNLEWCTYSENSIHSFNNGLQIPLSGIDNPSYGKFGKLNAKSKEVLMLSLDNEPLKKFESIEIAVRWLKENGYKKANSSSISLCCRGIRYKTAYKKIWRFTNEI